MTTTPSRLQQIAQIYNLRAPTYDSEPGYHPYMHSLYLSLISPSPSLQILDLACGTGGISIPLAHSVPSGSVIGLDISSTSLDIAKEKARKDGLENIKFLLHDVSNIDGLEGVEEGKFDVICCASAFALLPFPLSTIKNWSKYLKPGGKIIFDILTPDSSVEGIILEKVAKEMGLPKLIETRFDGREKVVEMLEEAGLDGKETFVSGKWEGEGVEKVLEVERGGEIFDGIVGRVNGMGPWVRALAEEGRRERSREVFCRVLREMGGEEGKVRNFRRAYVGIGRKL